MALSDVVVGIVDSHLHQWNPRRTPWAASRASRFYSVVPRLGDRLFPLLVSPADREYVLTPATVARRYEPAEYLTDAVPVHNVAGVPIDTVVYVESHWRSTSTSSGTMSDDAPEGISSEDEVRYVTGLPFGVGGAPRLGAIVVHGDPRALGFAARLDRQMSESDVVRGVRWGVARHPDPRVRDFGDADGILASPSFLSGFAAVAERGLSFDVSLYSHQLYDAVTLAREYPETTFVLDHIGAPVGVFGPVGARTGATAAARADILRLWRERIVTLAATSNVVAKLSGLALPTLGYGRARWGNIGSRATLTEMIGPLVTHVVDHFGPSRVMFGSNFPIDSPNASMDMIVGSLLDILDDRGDYLLQCLFRENALRVYRI